MAATPEPMARPSSSDSPPALEHPTPDLQTLQGAYVSNIEKLEQHAERMSMSGSDIGEEIRKLQLEQKLSESRRNSIRSSQAEEAGSLPQNRSRNVSTSSYSNSIVDLNNNLRRGGGGLSSPGGYITSPGGSIRSGSWSHQSLPRPRSSSRVSRLGAIDQNGEELKSPASIDQASAIPLPQSPYGDSTPYEYAHIAQEMIDFDNLASRQQEEYANAYGGHMHYSDIYPQRPASACSGDTFQQANKLFQDFDGVHYAPTEVGDAQSIRHSSYNFPHPPQTSAHAPPDENMVYYPAPVPRMLNLPKRLSQLPSTSVQTKRRTQLLEEINPEARRSSIWHGPEHGRHSSNSSANLPESPQKHKGHDPRQSTTNFTSLPPQLRASVYFDPPPVEVEVPLQDGSATRTLEGILEASTRAPVSAFVDHPFAGHVGAEVYGKESARKSTATLAQVESEPKKNRSSLNILLGRRRSSSTDQITNKLQKRNSTMTVATVIGPKRNSAGGDTLKQTDAEETDHTGKNALATDDDRLQGQDDEGQLEDVPLPDEPQIHGAPTTLLAELQIRKQQQRQRNRTAATAFPNGMHSTLLELDAVAAIEKQKRFHKRPALAWEDPDAAPPEMAEDEDEDVPLGMLYAGKKGVSGPGNDLDRPLGLIEKRELEDNEPLSSRRARLRGEEPNRLSTPNIQSNPQATRSSELLPNIAVEGLSSPGPEAAKEEDDDENETLAQRTRRLRSKQALDKPIEELHSRNISGEFASELLSRLGGDGDKKKPDATPPATADEEEETLGQRRARLQAEALARGGSGEPAGSPGRHALRQSHSLADLLAAHPVTTARKVSNDALVDHLAPGSLLSRAEKTQTKHKKALLETNRRSSSYMLEKPLVDVGDRARESDPRTKSMVGLPVGGMPMSQPQMGMLNTGMPMSPGHMSMGSMGGMSVGMGMGPMMSPYMPPIQQGMWMPGMMGFQPNMGVGFPSPHMGAMAYPNMMGLPMQQPPMMGAMGFPQNGMAMMPQAGMQSQASMDPRQREKIDRWRMGVSP